MTKTAEQTARQKPDAPASTSRTPVIVHCGKCAHEWTVAYAPMEMRKIAVIIGAARCPSCGERAKNIFMGPAK